MYFRDNFKYRMPNSDFSVLKVEDNEPMDLENYECKKSKNSVHSVSPIIAGIFIIAVFALYGFVYLIDGILPKPLNIADEEKYPANFITERAQQHLKSLTNIGPRIAGTPENEILAVEFLQKEIRKIQQLAHSSHNISLDLQVVSGSYFVDYKPDGAISVYSNVQNVVVKMYAANASLNSLLLNAHFDSVPTSPGGSDDGINCVIMLEVLQKLSQSPNKLQHNVIFLFNGAEETPLQASHGFITKHKWAKEVRVVINLEAAGAGGKEILFQSGPKRPWLLNYYKKVPRPNGQAAGEEIFQSGLIPSDTDFRIFRDFGKVVGFDFAFNRNGYRYHTKYDDFENIPGGSYQHAGDNVLSLVINLANAPELADVEEEDEENVVFYDFMGLFMISYSESVATAINAMVSVLSLGIACKSFYDFGLGLSRQSLTYIGWCFVVMLLSILCAALITIIIALLVDALNFSLSWYRNPWIILGLYVVPVVVVSYGVIVLYNHYNTKNNLSISIQSQIQSHIIRILWSILILIGTFCGIRAVYPIVIMVFFQTISFCIMQVLCLQHSVQKWLIVYVLSTIIPNIFMMKSSLELLSVIIPICGRIGSDKNPELIVGILTCILTIIVSSSYAPLITLVRKPWILLAMLSAVFAVFFIIVFTPLAFPYSGNHESPAPQRFWIYHMSRRFRAENNNVYKNDSGFFLLNLDRNSPGSIKNHVKDLNRMRSIEEDCDNIFCGLPIASSRIIPVLRTSTWIPAQEPILPNNVTLKLNWKISPDDTRTIFNLTAAGTNYMNVYLSPRNNATIKSISLLRELPQPIIWNNRSVYLIMHTCGKEKVPLTFSVEVEKPKQFLGSSLDVAVTGRFMYDKVNVKTPEYIQFLNQFPDWAVVYSWLSTYESWIF